MPDRSAAALGLAPGQRVAIVHCDDIGMCHAANAGAFEVLLEGRATCGSVMVPCPWFPEAAARARRHPELDLGVHLTLNAEWEGYRWGPVLGAGEVPSLVDAGGHLPRTSAEVVARARPDEVRAELRAQVERALEAGLDVTHLDAHMGTAIYPPFLEIYAELAEQFRLPAMLVRPDPALLRARGLALAQPVFEALVERLEGAGFPVLDGLDPDSLGFAEGSGEAHNRARLERLAPGLNYLICHPARDGEELRAATPDSAHQRDFERRFWGGGGRGGVLLDELGIATLGMRPLRDLLRGG